MLRVQLGLRSVSSQVASPSVIQRGQRLWESPRCTTWLNSCQAVRAQEKVPRISARGDTLVTTGPKQTPRAGKPSKPTERTLKSEKRRNTSTRVRPGVCP